MRFAIAVTSSIGRRSRRTGSCCRAPAARSSGRRRRRCASRRAARGGTVARHDRDDAPVGPGACANATIRLSDGDRPRSPTASPARPATDGPPSSSMAADPTGDHAAPAIDDVGAPETPSRARNARPAGAGVPACAASTSPRHARARAGAAGLLLENARRDVPEPCRRAARSRGAARASTRRPSCGAAPGDRRRRRPHRPELEHEGREQPFEVQEREERAEQSGDAAEQRHVDQLLDRQVRERPELRRADAVADERAISRTRPTRRVSSSRPSRPPLDHVDMVRIGEDAIPAPDDVAPPDLRHEHRPEQPGGRHLPRSR